MIDKPLNTRGRREVRLSLIDAAKRAGRRADELRARVAALEAEMVDIDQMCVAIEVAISIIDADDARIKTAVEGKAE